MSALSSVGQSAGSLAALVVVLVLAVGCGARTTDPPSADVGIGSESGADADSDTDRDAEAQGPAAGDVDGDVDLDGPSDHEDSSQSEPTQPRTGEMCSLERGCPCGLVGAISTVAPAGGSPAFHWYEFLGEHTLGPRDQVSLWFSVLPAEGAWTSISMDEIGARTGYQIDFVDGQVNAALPYADGRWHRIHATFRMESQDLIVRLGNDDSVPIPFYFDGVSTLQSLSVAVANTAAPATAWIDGVSVSIITPEPEYTETVLFTEDFDEGHSFEPIEGTLDADEPPEGSQLPEGCS